MDIHIDRPPQEVFDFMSDPANLPRWNSVIQSAEWTTRGEPGVGSTARLRARVLGSRKEVLWEFVAWDPPRRYSYAMRQRFFPMAGLETVMTFEPEGRGTRVRFDGRAELVGPMKPFDRLFAAMGRRTDGQNLATAKRILEST